HPGSRTAPRAGRARTGTHARARAHAGARSETAVCPVHRRAGRRRFVRKLGLTQMLPPTRRLSAVVVPIFVAVAIIGFLVGHRGSHTAPPERLLTASVANVLLNYPSAWQTSATAPEIHGLALTRPLVLAPP